MIDELLGKAELRDRIEELEDEVQSLREERDDLKAQLDATDRRRKEAVRNRQEAEERINRLEDRVAQLQGEVDRLTGDDMELSYRGRTQLHQSDIVPILDRLQRFSGQPESVLTAVVDDDLPTPVETLFGARAGLIARAAPCVVVADDEQMLSVALSPPLQPEPSVTWERTPTLDRSWFLPTGSYTFALVRSDLFAMAEYEGDQRQSFRGFKSDVMGDHSKGGFSQDRFERRRDQQRQTHLTDCETALTERSTERLYLVGEQTALDDIDVSPTARATVDATGEPEAALTDAYRDFWTTTLYLI